MHSSSFDKHKFYSEKRVTPGFQSKDKPKNPNLTLTCPILPSIHVLNTVISDYHFNNHSPG